MPFDLPAIGDVHSASAARAKAARGASNYLSGLAAEDAVAAAYSAKGATLLARRWRGQRGEVDLIVKQGAEIVFVEVKAGPTLDAAAARLTSSQLARIATSAEEFVDTLPSGQLTPVRIDGALVDASGRIEILENVLL